MADINDTLVRDERQPVICTRAAWSDEWEVRTDLIVQSLELSLGSIGRATFIHYYGSLQQGTDNQYFNVDPASVDNLFVKVVATPTDPDEDGITWYGVFVVDELESHGADASPMAGNQRLVAYSLEYILTRIQLTYTVLDDGNAVKITAPFNGFRGDRSANRAQNGNKSPDSELFSRELSSAVEWTASDIVTYLKRYCGPQGPPSGRIDGATLVNGIDDLFDFTPEMVPTAGQTVYQVLDSLFHPQRGLAWRLVVSPYFDALWRIEAYSLADESLELPSGVRVTEAQVKKSFEAFNRRDLLDCTLQQDRARKYDRIVVEGGQFGSVFELSTYLETLEPDWTDEELEAYKAGASAEDGYAALDLAEKKTRNDDVRASEKCRHVFARYRVPKNWTATSWWSEVEYPVFPAPYTDGEYDSLGEFTGHSESENLWLDSMRFLPYLPLKTQTDYATAADEPASSHLADTLTDFRRPFVVVGRYANGTITNDAINLTSSLETAADDETVGIGISASVEVHEHQLGVTINANKLPHCLQNTHIFDGTDPAIAPSHYVAGPQNPIGEDEIYVTVYARSSNNVIVRYPEALPSGLPYASELVIRLGDKARVDYLLPGTIVDVQDRHKKFSPIGRILRDDRLLMMDIALRAWQYHKVTRNVVALKFASIYNGLQLGDMITHIQLGGPTYLQDGNGAYITTSAGSTPDTISNELIGNGNGEVFAFNDVLASTGEQTVTPGTALAGTKFIAVDGTNRLINTVVSRIIYDFMAMTTHVQTQFAELNFAGVIDA